MTDEMLGRPNSFAFSNLEEVSSDCDTGARDGRSPSSVFQLKTRGYDGQAGFKCGFRMNEMGWRRGFPVKGLGTVSDVGRQTVLRQDLACKLGA